MDKIILRRIRKSKPQSSKVIRVDGDIYTQLENISDETSITIQRLTSMLLEKALANVKIIDDESEETET